MFGKLFLENFLLYWIGNWVILEVWRQDVSTKWQDARKRGLCRGPFLFCFYQVNLNGEMRRIAPDFAILPFCKFCEETGLV
ncbi:MAG: hypothetical protein A2504_14400 [Bdellovibrionales bacterium RIFOXYD12_FULL_39_22]|nr:MAG: hypothetical protein A2385_04835 [Bdellovibrionales bacterium RIFOXYB1_FULL_39_21]OFZ43473.1 MAG: hypothetical protein A2485_13350 [Bdellovibrionales bacterium RIFOXYC12_FULL_39_17]OFZ47016.1 MAG: hypothetical protein A2404_00410 [Bdellovibrionales bacterium RIFOXYC1_FULL_39_130]OFZ73076.1 MAG: hypothetical protein A2451_08090 [Bdellovibrionales bacterium RIFOXYC2_FULL_39_8]OFZ76213.1 MAG: hypothetical protein A2560_07660 [Bdellovibrionales bacterium RIFOXYD1_FULL_39_84]OFZ94448.1 MAG: